MGMAFIRSRLDVYFHSCERGRVVSKMRVVIRAVSCPVCTSKLGNSMVA